MSRPRIPLFRVHAPASALEPFAATWKSGFIGEGPRAAEFERDLADWLDCGSILALNSATSAITLALRLAGVDERSEVITTPMTCKATIDPIRSLGAKVVWADVNAKTGNILAYDVGERITGKTKAILAVNWGGYPCDMDELQFHADRVGAKLIVDNAHGMGASYHGHKVWGDFTVFSFQAIKHLTTGDGGALWCSNKVDEDRGRRLRWYGMDRTSGKDALRCEDDVAECGYKFHMNDLNATLGIENLKYASGIVAAHQRNAAKYDRNIPDISAAGAVTRLTYKQDRQSSYWIYTCRHHERDAIIDRLHEAGIGAAKSGSELKVHVRCDLHSCFRAYRGDHLPGVESFDNFQFSIPCGWWLSEEDTDYIIDCVTHAHERIKAHANV